MSKFSKQDLEALAAQFQSVPGDVNSRSYINFLTDLQNIIRKRGIRVNVVVNKMFGKSLKRSLRELLKEDLSDMPLYLNDPRPEVTVFAQWRIRIGK